MNEIVDGKTNRRASQLDAVEKVKGKNAVSRVLK